ncbi:MAG UNVERIFIED_CONTAM: hypothetical protein LVT10_18955 [Anaerolineae bacterium]
MTLPPRVKRGAFFPHEVRPHSPNPFPRSALPTREGRKDARTGAHVPSPTSEAQWGRAREGKSFHPFSHEVGARGRGMGVWFSLSSKQRAAGRGLGRGKSFSLLPRSGGKGSGDGGMFFPLPQAMRLGGRVWGWACSFSLREKVGMRVKARAFPSEYLRRLKHSFILFSL